MRYAIYGAAGNGRDVAPLAKAALAKLGRHPDDLMFVSDLAGVVGTVINDIPVIDFATLCGAAHRDRKIVISLADAATRRAIAAQCTAAGLQFGSLIADTHRAYDDVTVGEGAIIGDFSLFTANIRIGRHFQCNIYSYVTHDCVIGDFVTFGPRVNCNGRIVIEDDVYIGTGACLKQGSATRPLVIGKGAVVGMGAVVTRDVPPGAVVVGNPARPITK